MIKNLSWVLVLILLLSLPALACGVFGGDEDEATTVPGAEESVEDKTAPEIVTEEGTAVTVANAPALSISAVNFPTAEELPFDSFRTIMSIEFNGVKADGESVTQSINSEFAFTADPLANSTFFTSSGIQGSDLIEMAQIGDFAYIFMAEIGGCITTGGEDVLRSDSVADTYAPDDFLQNLENAEYVGEETINDIRTLHYSFDEITLGDTGDDEVDEAEGHIFIAKDGGFLVRMVVDAAGNIDFFNEGIDQSGDLHIEINLVDVDEILEITKPSDCEGDDTDGAYLFPVMDDATGIISYDGSLRYRTSLTINKVLAFYGEKFLADGWVEDRGASLFSESGGVKTVYTRGDETIELTTTTDPEKDGTYVVLIGDAYEFR